MKRFVFLRSSVFTRFVAFFLAAILPISCIAIYMYSWQIAAFDRATIDNYEATMRSNVNSMETELQKVASLCLDFLSDENLLMLSSASSIMTIYEKTTAINRLFSRLNVLEYSSPYIKNIRVYLPELQRRIDSNSNIMVYSINEVVPGLDRQAGKLYFSMENNNLYTSFLPVGSSIDKNNFRCALVVEFAKDQLLKELENGAPESAFCLVNSQNQPILQADSPDLAFSARDISVFTRESFSKKIKHEGASAWQYVKHSNFLDVSFTSFLPLNSINPLIKILRNYFIVFIAVFIISTLIIIFKTYQLVKAPLELLVGAFNQVEQGKLSVRLKHSKKDEFGYIYHSFNKMVSKIQDLMEQVYQQRILAQEAHLKQLQSQINPHFLYNSFFVISNMARLSDVDSIKRFSEYLAKYYQFMTQRREGDVPFSEEVEHSQVYGDIQKMRFGDRLDIRFTDLPPHAGEVMVPRLILQPLVENAFEHGLRDVTDKGILQVSFKARDKKLVVTVENNGELTQEVLESLRCKLVGNGEVSGIINIHKRLQLRYGKESGVTVSRSSLGGLKITLTIVEDVSDG